MKVLPLHDFPPVRKAKVIGLPSTQPPPPLSYARPRIKPRSASLTMSTLTAAMVLCLLSIAAAILVPRMVGRSETTGRPTQSDMIALQNAISQFQIDTGRLPSTTEGFNALFVCPKDLPGWHGPYLARRPKDAWGNPYTYRLLPTGGFELRSAGQDGKLFTLDDNVLSN